MVPHWNEDWLPMILLPKFWIFILGVYRAVTGSWRGHMSPIEMRNSKAIVFTMLAISQV